MADIQPSSDHILDGVLRITWENLSSDDQAIQYTIPGTFGAIANVQAVGNFGGGALVSLDISNDEANFAALSDLNGNAISLSAADECVDFSTAGLYLRPRVTGGSGETITVIVVLRS